MSSTQDEQFDTKVADICGLYRQAKTLTAAGERVLSTDELTGVQALERKHPRLAMVPGKVERREFEYVRHGTRSFIFSRDVVSGELIAPTVQRLGKRRISWRISKPCWLLRYPQKSYDLVILDD